MRRCSFRLLLFSLLLSLVPCIACAALPVSGTFRPGSIPSSVDIDEYGGANRFLGSGDNPDSLVYRNPGFFSMEPNDGLLLLKNFETYQQTSEWSCGPASALMVLRHFGVSGSTEWDIAMAMRSHTDKSIPGAKPGSARKPADFGTSVARMDAFFRSVPGIEVVESSYRASWSAEDVIAEDDESRPAAERGNLPGRFSPMSLYTAENRDDASVQAAAGDSYFVRWLRAHLEAGRPVLVEWADWGGHWQAIIGYHDNGTPGIGDDILIFADPYDTSDHLQDGYYVYPLERWFFMWHDFRIAPKPFQIQPYIVVDRLRLSTKDRE